MTHLVVEYFGDYVDCKLLGQFSRVDYTKMKNTNNCFKVQISFRICKGEITLRIIGSVLSRSP